MTQRQLLKRHLPRTLHLTKTKPLSRANFLGSLSVLTKQPRYVSAQAVEDTIVFRISAEHILNDFDRVGPLLRTCVETGFVPPDHFIPVAEDLGVIGALTDIALEQTCDTLHQLQQAIATDAPLFASINVSGHDIARVGFPEVLAGDRNRDSAKQPDGDRKPCCTSVLGLRYINR